MQSKIINMPANTCINKTLEYFDKINNKGETLFKNFYRRTLFYSPSPKDKPLSYVRTNELEIKFEKFLNFYYTFPPRGQSLTGKIRFEGNGETKINIIYNKGWIYLFILICAFVIPFFYAFLILPRFSIIYQLDFSSKENPLDFVFIFVSFIIILLSIFMYFTINFYRDEKYFANLIFNYLLE